MKAELLERTRLSASDRSQMYGLLARSFENIHREVFEADLSQKQHVVLLRDESAVVRGFTSFVIEPVWTGAERTWTLYSGDTIVERAYWGSPALPSAWIGAVRALRAEHSLDRLSWLLICSGPRTYRFLPVFFQSFYPRFDAHTPFPVQVRMDRLAMARYGSRYDAATGIVALEHPQPLRPELRFERGIPRNGHVSFFHRKNPGHLRGDELVCYTEVSDENLTRAGARMLRASDTLGLPPLSRPVAL